jgi:hypothetical protein
MSQDIEIFSGLQEILNIKKIPSGNNEFGTNRSVAIKFIFSYKVHSMGSLSTGPQI